MRDLEMRDLEMRDLEMREKYFLNNPKKLRAMRIVTLDENRLG
jgi:hypothetical protein